MGQRTVLESAPWAYYADLVTRLRLSYNGKTSVCSDAVWYQCFAQLDPGTSLYRNPYVLANLLGPESSIKICVAQAWNLAEVLMNNLTRMWLAQSLGMST